MLSLAPLRLLGVDGQVHSAGNVAWVMSATDAGWLEPRGLEWQRPGQAVFLKLLKGDEWVAARVAQSVPELVDPFASDENIYLPLDGVDGLPGVIVQDEVGMLFTPLEECNDEFGNIEPRRGGTLVDHLAKAFVPEQSRRSQKKRWIKEDQTNAQYPLKCVWMHPKVKEQALSEFARRCHEKKRASPSILAPEAVMLVGPPAAGKSSIERLPPEEVAEDLRETAASLKFREEINNDNLTDCMPGFEEEFRLALDMEAQKDVQIGSVKASASLRLRSRARTLNRVAGLRGAVRKSMRGKRMRRERAETSTPKMGTTKAKSLLKSDSKKIDWAVQWLVYTMFHHGPVRDSLAWDVIKVSIVDASELPVYYSSVMAGKQCARTMRIIDLAQSSTAPVPHAPLRFVGFWPYASQEAREERQKQRFAAEKAEGKLKGGNIDVNLVNLHYHAQQAETNIPKMLSCLRSGSVPSDDSSEEEVFPQTRADHFLIIQNDGGKPSVLFDWAHGEDSEKLARQKIEMRDAARHLLEWVRSVPDWSSLCRTAYRIAAFFLPPDDPMLSAVREERSDLVAGTATQLEELVPLLAEIDEIFFKRVNPQSTAADTRKFRPSPSHVLSKRGLMQLDSLSDEEVRSMKRHISMLRMFCGVLATRCIRDIGKTVPKGEREASPESV